MNVLFVSRINFLNLTPPCKQAHKNDVSYGLRMQKPITSDTVSFKGLRFDKILEGSATKTNERLTTSATIYMDILESIAMKLKNFGVSFDRDYCEPNAIKSAKSVISKIKRSKTFIIPDRIRGTLYCKNIYDLSVLFNQILPELKKRGYEVALTEVPIQDALKRGYIPKADELEKGSVIYPDVDIRLDNTLVQAEALPDNMKYSLGKPQPSGYEDVQIRLKKTAGSNSNTLHELIIIVGPKYAEAKHDESDRIYSYIRQFKELYLINTGKNDDETMAKLKRYMDLISKVFSTEITQKIYENAKSADIYGIVKPMPISLNDDDESILTSYYDDIEKITKEYYKKMIEAKAKTPKVQERLKKEKNEDMAKLALIRQGLTEAYDFYKDYPNKTNTKKKKK